jgi:UDP-glucose 4-epimerase
MGDEKAILVTGVAGYWGARVAERLVTEAGCHVIGLDVGHPPGKIQGLDFIQADVRNPLLVDLLKSEAVDTVCHLAFVETDRPSEAAFDANVVGTGRLLGACVEAGVRKVVLKSSTAVYGARPSNSAFLTEERSLRGSRRCGYIRDLVEIEAFCSGLRRQASQMILTILRFPSIVGPTADTPMTRFLKDPYAPSLLGFDPMMQLIHEDDVTAALVHAVHNDVPGVFNVAAEDVLPLNKIRGLAGKPLVSVFHPFAYWGVKLLNGTGLPLRRVMPIELDYIRYPWVADLTRMGGELGFEPLHTAEETLREFAAWRRIPGAEIMSRGEERLRDIMEQRRRARERQAAAASGVEEGGANEWRGDEQ